MKAIILHTTVTLTMVLLSMEISLTWLALLPMDMALLAWCKHHITPRELTKLTGYNIWKKTLN